MTLLRGLLERWLRPAETADVQRAHTLFDAGDFASAAALYEAALRLKPHPTLCVNAGYSRLMLGDYAAAGAAFRRALELSPRFPAALIGLGDTAARASGHDEAVVRYDEALAALAEADKKDASLAIAHNNRAQSLFALGRTREAWRDAEWRYAAPGAKALYPHSHSIARWQGKPLSGRLLVRWEQGYGDIIQHLRFLPLLDGRVADFVFECPPPLLRLAARLVPRERLIEARDEPVDSSGFAAYVPLLSLPYVLDQPPDRLPPPPYAWGDAARAAELRASWAGQGAELVGIAWRGSAFDPSRNAALRDFAPLAAGPVRLVSLQKDADAAEIRLLGELGGVDAASMLEDFASTADVIAALDRVVSVDTAVAHLAGAMAKPVSLLLNEPAAVRWMLEREDTPWYPGMRLHRKAAQASWSALIGGLL